MSDYIIQRYSTFEFKIIGHFEQINAVGSIGVNNITAPQMLPILEKTLQRLGQNIFGELINNYKDK